MTERDKLSESMMTSAVGVLGSMLIDENAIGAMLMAVNESDFRLQEQKTIFRTIKALYGEGERVDAILVNEKLGGKYTQYLADIINATPTAANADAYAKELRRASRLWQLREIGALLLEAETEDEARAQIDRASLLFCERGDVRRVTMEQAFREFWKRKAAQEEKFIDWGFAALDRMIHVGGGDMVVIGGRPSAGKTALALQLAFYIGLSRRVGFFSYETGVNKLYDRTISCQTATSFKKIMRNNLEEADYSRIRTSRRHLTAPVLDLIEAAGMTVNGIGAYAMANHYDVIVIDYLQKIPVPKVRDSFQRVSEVSDSLRQLARQTGKVVIALSQLRRNDDDKAPTMSDLRESGQIEQDADVIMLLYKENPKDKRSRRVLDIAKNKDGEPDRGMLLNFDGDRQTFSPVKKEPGERPEPKKHEGPSQTEIYYQNLARQAQELDNPSVSHAAAQLPLHRGA